MHRLRARFVWILSFAIFLFGAARANAHVTRVEIISRTDIQDGRAMIARELLADVMPARPNDVRVVAVL